MEKLVNKGINDDKGKQTEPTDIARDGSLIWAYNENNPDYKLVIINAANDGFQSKMRIDTGSYVITQFTKRLEDNIRTGNDKYFNEILDDIQEDLHEKGKQLITKAFNNKTEKMIFLARLKSNNDLKFDNDAKFDDNIELSLQAIQTGDI